MITILKYILLRLLHARYIQACYATGEARKASRAMGAIRVYPYSITLCNA